MQILQNISLRPCNTFGIDVNAEYYAEVHDEQQLPELSGDIKDTLIKHVLGGGSNILMTGPIKGLVIKNCLKGIKIVREDKDQVWLSVGAGEVWHELVLHTIAKGWGGLENLSLIPGCVGASPIQNIGAYGVEVKECIDSVNVWNWAEKKFRALGNEECSFGYRDSIFKHQLKDKVIVTSVVFRLNKKHNLTISYGAIKQQLTEMGIEEPTIRSVSDAVIAIRSSKLPDPKKIGNAGSFFKNTTIPKTVYEELIKAEPNMPSYPVDSSSIKVPAGWLIEQCGWKGFRDGDAGVHAKQALVLVNYGHAAGSDIWELSDRILASVKDRFGIDLEREVQVW
jgi:UDP-N-acetylmuramate dehydrogenase